jgi:hypothetical protein
VLAEDNPDEICPIDAGMILPDIFTKTLSGVAAVCGFMFREGRSCGDSLATIIADLLA